MRPNAAVPALLSVLAIAVLAYFGLSTLSEKRLVSPPSPPAQARPNQIVQTAPKVDFADPVVGVKDAAVTIVEYGDYLCGPCGDLEPTVLQILKEYPDKVRFVWKDYPNEAAHPGAYVAAEAARCAGLQDAFWPMHDRLFANQASLNSASLPILAEGLPLDVAILQTCLSERQAQPLVDRDVEEGQRLRVEATPTIFINDQRFTGAMSIEALRTAIGAAGTNADADGGK